MTSENSILIRLLPRRVFFQVQNVLNQQKGSSDDANVFAFEVVACVYSSWKGGRVGNSAKPLYNG